MSSAKLAFWLKVVCHLPELLTQWGRGGMAATTFSNAFACMKIIVWYLGSYFTEIYSLGSCQQKASNDSHDGAKPLSEAMMA